MKSGRLPSQMKHQFSQVPRAEIPRSTFDRSHSCKTTFDAGYLVPILVDEALPGDTFNVNLQAFARLATPLFPIMDNMKMTTFFFAVPNRLIWSNWEKFCGSQDDPGDSTDFTIPQINTALSIGNVGSIYDYMGLPLPATSPISFSALPFRAYNLIWNEWFRDQNLQDSLTVNLGDSDSTGPYALRRRGKRHDYFTSALPWPQKGDSVDLPLGISAPVVANGPNAAPTFNANGGVLGNMVAASGSGNIIAAAAPALSSNVEWNTPNLEADLSTATAATINQLRQAFQVQKLLERDARGGTRYTEVVKAHFGVTSPDARLQRPEYLGGGTTNVNISPIAQTSETSGSPQGNLAAIGTAHIDGHGFTKSFTEHCQIIGLVSVQADLTYQQGLERMWSRQTRYDFYWPALAHIGEQAVLSKEIYSTGDPEDDDVFGYQERYAEYRYKQSRITGLFRSNATASLDAWHLSQDFDSRPVLNASFIEDNPPVDRVIAVPAEPHFLFDSFFKAKTARPMPVYGVPGFIDHF